MPSNIHTDARVVELPAMENDRSTPHRLRDLLDRSCSPFGVVLILDLLT